MEVALLGSNSVKIKTKNMIFAVDPTDIKGKIAADAVLRFSKEAGAFSMDKDTFIVFGPGEYELKGVKFAGIGKSSIIAYAGKIDGIDICITKSSLITKAKDNFGEYNVVLINADEPIDQAQFARFNAITALFYGDKASEYAQAFGKELIVSNKHTITKDKLPAELEIVLLQ